MANPPLPPWKPTSLLGSGHLCLLAYIKALHLPLFIPAPSPMFLIRTWLSEKTGTDINGEQMLVRTCQAPLPGSPSWLVSAPLPMKLALGFSCPVFATRWMAARQASLSLTISRSLSKFISIVSVRPFSHLILWCPLLLLASIFPSIRDSSKESPDSLSKAWQYHTKTCI